MCSSVKARAVDRSVPLLGGIHDVEYQASWAPVSCRARRQPDGVQRALVRQHIETLVQPRLQDVVNLRRSSSLRVAAAVRLYMHWTVPA